MHVARREVYTKCVLCSLRFVLGGLERIGRVGMNNNRDDNKDALITECWCVGDVFAIDFVYGNIVEQGADRTCG